MTNLRAVALQFRLVLLEHTPLWDCFDFIFDRLYVPRSVQHSVVLRTHGAHLDGDVGPLQADKRARS